MSSAYQMRIVQASFFFLFLPAGRLCHCMHATVAAPHELFLLASRTQASAASNHAAMQLSFQIMLHFKCNMCSFVRHSPCSFLVEPAESSLPARVMGAAFAESAAPVSRDCSFLPQPRLRPQPPRLPPQPPAPNTQPKMRSQNKQAGRTNSEEEEEDIIGCVQQHNMICHARMCQLGHHVHTAKQ